MSDLVEIEAHPMEPGPVVSCLGCGRSLVVGRDRIWAHVSGNPYQAYYCSDCAKGTAMKNPMYCKFCGGDLYPLGQLGNLMWFRCLQCGMEQATKSRGGKRRSRRKGNPIIPGATFADAVLGGVGGGIGFMAATSLLNSMTQRNPETTMANMRGCDFTPDMQTPDRLVRYAAYTIRGEWYSIYGHVCSYYPALASQIPDLSGYRRKMDDLDKLGARLCGEEWDRIGRMNGYELSAAEERDCFISWIHRSEATRQAFIRWQNRLFTEGSIPDWPEPKTEKRGSKKNNPGKARGRPFCVYCGKPSIPMTQHQAKVLGLKRGQGICAYHHCVVQFGEDWCKDIGMRPNPSGEPRVIAQFRKIVDERQHGKVGGVKVDLFSASAVVSIYDALSEENKAMYAAMNPRKMISVAFKLMERQSNPEA